MSSRITHHIRSNAVGYAALFVALGGSAWAAATVGPQDIQTDAVRTRHILNGQVLSADIGNHQVLNRDIRNATVRGADLAAETLTDREIADSAVGVEQIEPDSVTGAHVDEESLELDHDFNRSDTPCVPGADFTVCVGTAESSERPGNVLVIATAAWHGQAIFGAEDTAACKLTRDGADSPTPDFSDQRQLGQSGDQHGNANRAASMSLIGIDANVPPGTHNWALECRDDSGIVRLSDARITTVELGP